MCSHRRKEEVQIEIDKKTLFFVCEKFFENGNKILVSHTKQNIRWKFMNCRWGGKEPFLENKNTKNHDNSQGFRL
jgi:hypothetical protein